MGSRFNKTAPSTKTTNLAGGQAFKQTEKLELTSVLLTSFVKDQFYRSADDTMKRVRELIEGLKDKKFAAQAALYARNRFGMRSISHVVGGEIARLVKGEEWTKRFFEKLVHRPDDITETLAYYMANYAKPLPNSMKKGFAAALATLDAYKLAKYKGEGKAVSMVDAVNLVHPRATEAITALMKGTLKPAETWETKLTQAGQKAENDEQKEELKGAAWKELLEGGKLGYFALLRNLRNIIEQAPDTIPLVARALVDETAIRKSLVLPFRYMTAFDALSMLPSTSTRPIIAALNQAFDLSVKNVPKFDGKTLIVVDKSGSMNGQPITIASLFAAVLYKTNNADLMLFASTAQYLSLNPSDSTATIAQQIRSNGFVGGTDFHAPFRTATEKYDRIIILSDMQGWIGYECPTATFNEYKKRTGANPHVYSFDLAGNGTLQFPEPQVYCLAGFSEKVFDIMKMLEEDRNALVHAIEAIEI